MVSAKVSSIKALKPEFQEVNIGSADLERGALTMIATIMQVYTIMHHVAKSTSAHMLFAPNSPDTHFDSGSALARQGTTYITEKNMLKKL